MGRPSSATRLVSAIGAYGLRAAVREPPAARARHAALRHGPRACLRSCFTQAAHQEPFVVAELRRAMAVGACRVEDGDARFDGRRDRREARSSLRSASVESRMQPRPMRSSEWSSQRARVRRRRVRTGTGDRYRHVASRPCAEPHSGSDSRSHTGGFRVFPCTPVGDAHEADDVHGELMNTDAAGAGASRRTSAPRPGARSFGNGRLYDTTAPDPVSLQILVKALAASAAALATSRFGAELAAFSAVVATLVADAVKELAKRRGWGRKRVAALTGLLLFFSVCGIDEAFARFARRLGLFRGRKPQEHLRRRCGVAVATCPRDERGRARHRRPCADSAGGCARPVARDRDPGLHVLRSGPAAVAIRPHEPRTALDHRCQDRRPDTARPPGTMDGTAGAELQDAMASV